MKRVDKNKDIYKKLVEDELMLIKIRHSLTELGLYTEFYGKDNERADSHWDRFYSNWTDKELMERQFVSQCFWVNQDVAPIDVLRAMEIVKESKNEKTD